jgi:hypothetical protein
LFAFRSRPGRPSLADYSSYPRTMARRAMRDLTKRG